MTVNATNLPEGVTAIPAIVGSNQKWGTLVLKTTPGKKQFGGFVGFIPRNRIVTADLNGTISCQASAEIDGKTVTRPVRSATITWGINQGQNIPTATRLDQSLPIAVRGNYAMHEYSLTAQLNSATTKTKDGKDEPIKPPFVVKSGEKIVVPFAVNFLGKDRPPVTLAVEPTHSDNQRAPLSGNNTNITATIAKDKNDAKLTFEMRPNAAPGLYRFMVRADLASNVNRAADKKSVNNVGQSAFTPVDIRVVPTSLAKLTANNVSVRIGSSSEVTVKVERNFEFNDDFAVYLVFPQGRGLSAVKTILPPGKNEVKIPITASSDAKPGPVPNVMVVAVVKYEGTVDVIHEAKVNLTVAK